MTKTQKCGVCGQEHEVEKIMIGSTEVDVLRCPAMPKNQFLWGSIAVTIS